MASSFDRNTWKRRARARHKRALASGRSGAQRALDEDLLAIEGMTKLEAWCSERNVEIRFARVECAEIENDIITVNASSRAQTQLNLLLHEAGHYLVGSCGDKLIRNSDATRCADGKERTKFQVIDTIAEEIEAWRRGEKLAERLGIELNQEAFDKIKTSTIFSYIDWASEWRT